MKARIICPWHGEQGVRGMNYAPKPSYDGLVSNFQDVTSQDGASIPPDPNLVVIESEIIMDEISDLDADSSLRLIWIDGEREGDLDTIRSDLQNWLLNLGVRGGAVSALTATDTRWSFQAAMIGFLTDRPK